MLIYPLCPHKQAMTTSLNWVYTGFVLGLNPDADHVHYWIYTGFNSGCILVLILNLYSLSAGCNAGSVLSFIINLNWV